ncbi:MAG: hypothetical protein WA432_01325 [Candidatus Babeliaceae bacterium]
MATFYAPVLESYTENNPTTDQNKPELASENKNVPAQTNNNTTQAQTNNNNKEHKKKTPHIGSTKTGYSKKSFARSPEAIHQNYISNQVQKEGANLQHFSQMTNPVRGKQIVQALQHPYSFTRQTYHFQNSTEAERLLNECGTQKDIFENQMVQGLQHLVNQEVVNLIERGLGLRQQYAAEPVYHFTHIGAQCGVDAKMQSTKGAFTKSFSLLDFGTSTLDYAASIGQSLLSATVAVGTGIKKGVMNIGHQIEHLKHLVTHPTEIPAVLHSLGKTALELYESFYPPSWEDTYAQTMWQYREHPEQFQESDFITQFFDIHRKGCDRFTTNGSNLAQAIYDKYKQSSWYDIIEKSTELGSEVYLLDLLITEVSSLGKLAVQELKSIQTVKGLSKIELCQKAPAFALIAETTQLAEIQLASKNPELIKNVISYARNDAEFLASGAAQGQSAVETVNNFVQHLEEKSYKIVEATGEKCRIVAPENPVKAALEWAPKKYEEIRNLADDITKIARNTGMPEAKIERIKNHLFYDDTHILSTGIGRFAPDPEIVSVWNRLYNGDFIKNDIQLLEHEYFESKLEKIYKIDYETAHKATQQERGRPWFLQKFKS